MDGKTERLRSDCMFCILEKQIRKLPENITESKKVEFLQRIFRVFAEAPKEAGAPVLVRDIDNIKKEMFQTENEYGGIKEHFNQVMMGYEEMVRRKIREDGEPLKAALQFALVGNYIDFGAMKNVDESQLEKLIFHADRYAFEETEYRQLKEDLTKGKTLLYITDNCGEIVMDKLCMQTIKELYPQIEIAVLVRGLPVLNDATREDALQVGLDREFRICGSGSGIAGTCIGELSDEAMELFRTADVMIAKGQGNFESLRYCGKNIYYLFLCKCDMFARQFQVPKLTGMLVNDRNLD